MFCSKCGKQLQDGVQFCSNCGNEVNKNVVPQIAKEVKGPVLVHVVTKKLCPRVL